MIDLKTIVENEWFIVCDLLQTDRFITFCRDRGIDTSRDQLEQLEKLRLFFPLARVQFPKIIVKVEYSEDRKTYKDLGILEEDETWDGETREDYSSFHFTKKFAENWLEEGLLWEPGSRDFEPWSRFWEDEGRKVESYYSIFQCLPLHHLSSELTIRVGPEWGTYSPEQVQQAAQQIAAFTKTWIDAIRQNGCRGQGAALICQAISNRYYPRTHSDRRKSIVSRHDHYYYDWNWDNYCRNWDAEGVRRLFGLSIEQLTRLQEQTAMHAHWIDPLGNWYDLVRFVSVEQRKHLKGDALLAQTFYAMEEMLRLFYHDLTGERLYAPDESPSWRRSDFYGEGVPENELQYLEFLANQYHLNPRPRLILLVEGESEYYQIPRIARELLGYRMEQVGVQVEMLRGLGEAKKVERLIDHYHYRQTIVYLILDNDKEAMELRKKLLDAKSKYRDISRRITKREYVFLWEKCFEFDNFSDEEIARAMTEVAGGRYPFAAGEIAQARAEFGKQKDPLSILYRQKTGYGLNKPNLVEALVQAMLDNPTGEFSADGKPIRPITAKTWKIIQLAAKNYQPVRLKDWRTTQQSGFIRGSNEGSSATEEPEDKN